MDNKFSISGFLHNIIRKSQGLRFLLVGGINTLVGYSLFALFIYCGLYYMVAVFWSTALSAVFNFFTMGSLVFNKVDSKLFPRFLVVYAIIYFVSIAALKVGSYFISNIYINGLASIPLTAVTGFLLNKYYVFERVDYETN